MNKDLLDGVIPFLAVAEHLSFTRAGRELDTSPTAVSKAIRQLERRHGVLLFRRTTRNVTLTDAGATLFGRLRPAGLEIDEAFAALEGYGDRATGTLRLTMSSSAYHAFVEPHVAAYREACPDVTLDLSLNEGMVDLVAAGFDAGIRQGELIEKDLIAVRLSPATGWSVVGSPEYLALRGTPDTPEELVNHEAIHYRFVTSGTRYRWEFTRAGRDFTVDVPSHVLVNERSSIVGLALRGLGLAYLSDEEVGSDVEHGRLVRVLGEFTPPSTGSFLYFPTRTQAQPKLRAFIDIVVRRPASPQHPAAGRGAA